MTVGLDNMTKTYYILELYCEIDLFISSKVLLITIIMFNSRFNQCSGELRFTHIGLIWGSLFCQIKQTIKPRNVLSNNPTE